MVFIYFYPRSFVEIHLLLNSCREKFSLISQIRESGREDNNCSTSAYFQISNLLGNAATYK